MSGKETVLVFGGNGFIGAEVVDFLLGLDERLEFVLVNRGNWKDWDSAERIKARVKETIVLDRLKGGDALSEALGHYLSDAEFKFKAVLDFSAYEVTALDAGLRALPHDRIGLYVYISTDSVYEVSVDKAPLEGQKLLLSEEDSVRPASPKERDRLREFDSYGHEKLEAEERLVELATAAAGGFSYLSLRLPDVLGPRDSLERFWTYQMWLQFIDEACPTGPLLLEIPTFYYKRQTSYVYVKDVARFIASVLDRPECWNQIYNLGFERPLAAEELIAVIRSNVRPGLEKRLEFKPCDEMELILHPIDDYPSVTKGPISIAKLKRLTQFEPYDLDLAMKETIDFYNEAYKKFPRERKAIEKLIRKRYFAPKRPQRAFKLEDFEAFIAKMSS